MSICKDFRDLRYVGLIIHNQYKYSKQAISGKQKGFSYTIAHFLMDLHDAHANNILMVCQEIFELWVLIIRNLWRVNKGL